MADLSKIKIGSSTYDIKDTTARSRIPAGGNTGYVLTKISSSDYDFGWAEQIGGEGGVNAAITGNVLVFTSTALPTVLQDSNGGLVIS